MAPRPPKRRSPRPGGSAKPTRPAVPDARALRALERRIARLEADAAEAVAHHERQLAAVRRAADRRLTGMVREIASLRHHEARATALERLLAERDAMIARLSHRLAEVEGRSSPAAPPPSA